MYLSLGHLYELKLCYTFYIYVCSNRNNAYDNGLVLDRVTFDILA